jgi:hypothetical protein
LPKPETGLVQVATPLLLQEPIDGRVLGLGAGSAVCDYKITWIGHGVACSFSLANSM